MKNLLAIAIVMLFTAFAAQATDNCTASATGTFTFSVEQAIGLQAIGQTNFDLGGICPGCSKSYNACAGWTVTGGNDCTFSATPSFSAPTGFPTDIVVSSNWQYNDEGFWESWNGSDHDGLGNLFWINNANHSFSNTPTQFMVCVTNIATTCNDAAATYTLTYGLTVNYVCGL